MRKGFARMSHEDLNMNCDHKLHLAIEAILEYQKIRWTGAPVCGSHSVAGDGSRP